MDNMKVPKVPVIDINTGEVIQKYEKEKSSKSWVVIFRPTKEQERLIEEEVEADGFNPDECWYDLMCNVTDIWYVRAPTENLAESIIRKEYIPSYKVEKGIVSVRQLKKNPYHDRVHAVRGQEKMDWIYRIW